MKESSTAAFSIARDENLAIPYIKAAQGVSSKIHFWGSPWSPPPWMKTNTAYDGGNMKEDATTLQAFADYLADFVEAYGGEGHPDRGHSSPERAGLLAELPLLRLAGQPDGDVHRHLSRRPRSRIARITAEIFIGTMSNSDVRRDAACRTS